MIGRLLDLAEHVGTQHHGLTVVTGFPHHLQELPLHERVEPARRLIEHQQLRPVHERLDESELLLVALRQSPHLPTEVDIEPVGQVGDGARAGRAR